RVPGETASRRAQVGERPGRGHGIRQRDGAEVVDAGGEDRSDVDAVRRIRGRRRLEPQRRRVDRDRGGAAARRRRLAYEIRNETARRGEVDLASDVEHEEDAARRPPDLERTAHFAPPAAARRTSLTHSSTV